jgi:hypothetical protein
MSIVAPACAYCGVPNRRGVAALAAAASVALVAITAIVVVQWQRAPSRLSPSPAALLAPAGGDFAWLVNGMHNCDARAEREPDTLHFLVIPLAAPKNQADWRAKALNKVGNAILLRSDVALDGLKGRALAIAADGYVFSVRDQARVTYIWERTAGVAKFSIPAAAAIEAFNIQFQYRDTGTSDDWGNGFVRRRGNCYWVNAILVERI